MKITSAFFAGLLLIGALGVVNSATAADGMIEKVPLTATVTAMSNSPPLRVVL